MTRITGATVGVLLLALAAAAQSNEEKYHEKLHKEFVSKIAWEQQLDTAKQKCADEHKLIYAYFSRSYAP